MSSPSAEVNTNSSHLYLSLADSGLMHPLTRDYLAGKEEILPYFAWPLSYEGVKDAIEGRNNFQVDRKLLSSRLLSQYKAVFPAFETDSRHQAVLYNILAIEDSNTFTVTTGHQLSLFTGPLYFIYKILSAIRYAGQLAERFPKHRFIPVYWMASEDHDFDEVNHIQLWGRTISWERQSAGAVGSLSTAGLQPLIEDLKALLGDNENAAYLIDLFRRAYLEHDNLAQATRFLVHELFSVYGLLIIDANDPELKAKFKDVVRQDIFTQAAFEEVSQTNSVLGREYKLPVSPREINIFYLKDNIRERILKDGEDFVVKDQDIRWTAKELEEEINDFPEHFSPNVILRPMYQELILPNLAYIGGTNEIAYWLQLRAAFVRSEVFFPQLVVRDSALLIGKRASKDMAALNVLPQDLLTDWKRVEAAYYNRQQLGHPAEDAIERLNEHYEALRNALQGLPPEFIGPMIKQANIQQKEIKKWKNDIHRKQLELQDRSVQKLHKLHDMVFPEGIFQERHDNFIQYFIQYGPAFFSRLLENFSPLEGRLSILID